MTRDQLMRQKRINECVAFGCVAQLNTYATSNPATQMTMLFTIFKDGENYSQP